jgi:LacI family transcriptional regulator
MRAPRLSVLLFSTWYEQQVNEGIVGYARDANWVLEDMSRLKYFPSYWQGDGIITYARPDDHALVAMLKTLGRPVVNLAVETIPGLVCGQVLPDNRMIGRLGADHLIGRGYRNLFFFSLNSCAQVVQERLAGMREAAGAAGLEVVELAYQTGEISPAIAPVPWLCERLRALPRPIGLMVHYDLEAQYAIHACVRIELNIPGDVGLVGVDNDYVQCEIGEIPLTSVDCNFSMIGNQAAALLDRLMKGEPVPQEPIRIPPSEIVIRQSSDILKIKVEPLRKVLVHIAQNFTENLTADDLAKVAGVSRRQLYRLFDVHMGRTIHEEILDRRIDFAKRLLTSTGNKIEFVAQYAGFGSAEQFCKTFHREVGMPPSVFRRQSSS